MYIQRHRKQLRNPNILFDEGIFFVTSNVKGGTYSFGEINNKVMEISPSGEIAIQAWTWFLSQYPYITSHAFVVMPNHFHALIEYDENSAASERKKIKPLPELLSAYKA